MDELTNLDQPQPPKKDGAESEMYLPPEKESLAMHAKGNKSLRLIRDVEESEPIPKRDQPQESELYDHPIIDCSIPGDFSSSGSKGIYAIVSISIVAWSIVGWFVFWNSNSSDVEMKEIGVVVELKMNQAPERITPAKFTNSLSMPFVAIGGTYTRFCIWETRVRDFRVFVEETNYQAIGGMWSVENRGWKDHGRDWRNPGFNQTEMHPVVGISWFDAIAFCSWLTERERAIGAIEQTEEYRLPTDLEWSLAAGFSDPQNLTPKARLELSNRSPMQIGYLLGQIGNSAQREVRDDHWPEWWPAMHEDDHYRRTAPVGSFAPNNFGLFDFYGNAWEWCMDSWDGSTPRRVLRGGSWATGAIMDFKPTHRNYAHESSRTDQDGFRIVLALVGDSGWQEASLNAEAVPVVPNPSESSGSFPSPGNKFRNSLGEVLLPVSISNVLMNEHPVTVSAFRKFLEETGHEPISGFGMVLEWEESVPGMPGIFKPISIRTLSWNSPGIVQADDHPVLAVCYQDAIAYCDWLTHRERTANRIGPKQRYRLPLDIEWSFAVGIEDCIFLNPSDRVTNTKVGWEEIRNRRQSNEWKTYKVGTFGPNSNGFYDMGHYLNEWVGDYYRDVVPSSVTVRGIVLWDKENKPVYGDRSNYAPTTLSNWTTFRVVLEFEESGITY